MVHEGALPTLLCSLQPNITIIWDGQICMFIILLCFTLCFVYKVYIGFLSRVRDWTVAVAQYTKSFTVWYPKPSFSILKISDRPTVNCQQTFKTNQKAHGKCQPWANSFDIIAHTYSFTLTCQEIISCSWMPCSISVLCILKWVFA
jgi:hypothetical protein